MSLIDLTIVIPVYRSAATLPELVRRLLAVLDPTGLQYDVLFVEDGSPDDSWQVLRELQVAHPDRIAAIQLMRNFGQHNALMCGFRHARGRLVVTMDDDLQNPPEEIPKLLDAIRAGTLDLVYGSYDSKKHRAWRNLGSAVINAFYRTVFSSPETITSFRAIRRELLESTFSYDLNYTFVDGLFAWSTQRIGRVPVEHRPRAAGRSGYSLRKLVLLALNLYTNFSLIPLQLASVCGILAAGGGLLTAFYYLVQYFLSNIAVSGYASTIIAILVLGGIQLLALGIMGEYVGRLHLNVNRKPQYVVRRIAGQVAPLSGQAYEDGKQTIHGPTEDHRLVMIGSCLRTNGQSPIE
jgi:undecaprenyl-phosphate 4-deoxy-4-formamido-L-arabinose transferase